MVFEDMIDSLVSDDTKEKQSKLADQPDGKIVDHIYHYGSLVREDDIYYIGDSKYYKEGHDPGENSIYKQFTYAKNVIQMNMDVTSPNEQIGRANYYDEETEGYNITPNFFIRGMVNPSNLNYIEAELEQVLDKNQKPDVERRWHHQNRLFDRDTLFVLKYSINFLFVLSAYAAGRVDEAYKNHIREKFKRNLTEELQRKYHFYLLQSKGDRKEAVDRNFKVLNGKIFNSFKDDRCLLLAFEYGRKGISKLVEEIGQDFNVYKYSLGEMPHETMQKPKIRTARTLWEVVKKEMHQSADIEEMLLNDDPLFNHLDTLFSREEKPYWKDITSLWTENFELQDVLPDMHTQQWEKFVSKYIDKVTYEYGLSREEIVA